MCPEALPTKSLQTPTLWSDSTLESDFMVNMRSDNPVAPRGTCRAVTAMRNGERLALPADEDLYWVRRRRCHDSFRRWQVYPRLKECLKRGVCVAEPHRWRSYNDTRQPSLELLIPDNVPAFNRPTAATQHVLYLVGESARLLVPFGTSDLDGGARGSVKKS